MILIARGWALWACPATRSRRLARTTGPSLCVRHRAYNAKSVELAEFALAARC